MGAPVVVVSSGGLPVTEAANGYGLPVTVATNGFGTPITIVSAGGLPVVGSGGGGKLVATAQSPRLAVAGDSIAQALGTYTTTNSYNTLNSISGWANMLGGGSLYFPQGGNVAVGGRSVATIAGNFTAEIGPIGANIVFCNGGINDLPSLTVAQILAFWDSIIAQAAALPESPYLIILPITPSSTQLAFDANRLLVNAGLAARASNKVRILDITGFDYNTMCYAQVIPATGERIHPNVLGCQLLGPRLLTIIQAISTSYDPTLSAVDPLNKLGTIGGLGGTSGTLTSATGSVATGWTLDNSGSGGATVVGSKSTLAGGETAQQIVISGAYTGSSKAVSLTSGSVAVAGVAAGDLVEITAKIEVSGCSNVDGFGLFAFLQDSGFALHAQVSEMTTNTANDSGHTNPGNYTITLRTMPFGAPANTPAWVSLAFSAYLREGGSAAACAATIKIGRIAVRRITPELPGRMAAPSLAPSSASIAVTRAVDPPNNGANITSYDLRYSTDQATWTVVAMTSSPQTVSSLTNGTAYFVQTRANNSVGNGNWSASATSTPVAPVLTTLDPAGATANNVLSNGNLTVSGASNPGQFVRSVKSVTTGKFEVEFTVVAVGSGAYMGLADTSAALNAAGFNGLAGIDKALGCNTADGNVYCGSSFGTLGNVAASFTTGDKVRMCLDEVAKRVWFRKNNAGNWNGSGTASPATGVGGWNINTGAGSGTLSGAVNIAIGQQGGGASVTLDPDPTSKQSGFGAWLA